MNDPKETNSRRRFEVTDANPLAIFLIGLSLLAVIVASMAAVALIYRSHLSAKSGPSAEDFRGGARQRTSIEESWTDLDAENTRHLDGYRWIDKRTGVVQIPVEQAMELLAGKDGKP